MSRARLILLINVVVVNGGIQKRSERFDVPRLNKSSRTSFAPKSLLEELIISLPAFPKIWIST